jgi:hypothetical protein
LKGFYQQFPIFGLMSGKEFFVKRYREMGWTFRSVEARQAIRINQTNAKGKNLLERLIKRRRGTGKNPVFGLRLLGGQVQGFCGCNG